MAQRVYFGGGDGRRVRQFKAEVQEKTIIDSLLLRFRPIAPKPVIGDFHQKVDGVNQLVNSPRRKRKYVRVKGKKIDHPVQTDLSLSVNPTFKTKDIHRTSAAYPATVETWVTVESLTGDCSGVELTGATEMEKMRRLEGDTCPGFVSDGVKTVRWVNEAYKRMVMVREYGSGSPPEVTVCLGVKEKVLPCLAEERVGDGFGCWIRLQYKTWRQEEKVSQMVPCDVWRMEFGGFAWRMDVTAALSLAL